MNNPGFVKEGVELNEKMDARRGNTELRNPASQSFNTAPDDLPADLQVEIAKRYANFMLLCYVDCSRMFSKNTVI